MIRENEKTEKKKMQDLAIAMRISRADKKSFLNFISGDDRHTGPKGTNGYQYFKRFKAQGVRRKKKKS